MILVAKEFAQTQDIVEGYISRLDNPTNLGNDAADAK